MIEGSGAWVVWLLFLVAIAAAAAGFTVLGAYFLRRWLADPRTSLWALAVSVASLGAVCGLMFIYGDAYFTGLILTIIWGTATVTALVFLWRSRRMGRARMVIATAVLALAYPALLLQMPALYQRAQRPFSEHPAATSSATTAPSAARTTAPAPSTSQVIGSLYLSPLGYSVELISPWRRSDLQSRAGPLPQGDPDLLGVDLFTTRTPADEEAAMRRSDTGVGPAQMYTATVALYRNSRNETAMAFAQRVKGGSGLVAVSIEPSTVAGLAGVKTTFTFTTNDPQRFYTLYAQDRDWIWVIGYTLAPAGADIPAGATEQRTRGIVESFRFRR